MELEEWKRKYEEVGMSAKRDMEHQKSAHNARLVH